MPDTRPLPVAGLKRKLPFIDIEDFVSQPEAIYPELQPLPPRSEPRKRRVREWAQHYLNGGTIPFETAQLHGPFEQWTSQKRKRTKSGAKSVEQVKDPVPNETGLTGEHVARDRSRYAGTPYTPLNVGGVIESVEGHDSGPSKPIAVVQGKAIYSRKVVNNHGEKVDLSREVVTWPHELRLGNQIDRLEQTHRPYIQNTTWHRPKKIPPSDYTNVPRTPPGIPQEPSRSSLNPVAEWLESSLAAVDQESSSMSPSIPEDEHAVDGDNIRHVTPVRQMITINSQCLVIAEPPTLQHQDSCQTAVLQDDSQIRPGDIHTRLQQALTSNSPRRTDLEQARTDQEPLIKLKQLEDAIHRQLSTNRSEEIDSTVLVTSSLGQDYDSSEARKSSDENTPDLMCSASTDRVTSSQPEQELTVLPNIAPHVSSPILIPKLQKAPNQTSFSQSSIKKAFQVKKSFDGDSHMSGKKSFPSPNNSKCEDSHALTNRTVTITSTAINRPCTHSQKDTSTCVSRKSIQTYGKRKSQSSLFSRGANMSFFEAPPIPQRDISRSVVEEHGYNYDVGDDFDLDSSINELGTFLSSWDKEKAGIGI